MKSNILPIALIVCLFCTTTAYAADIVPAVPEPETPMVQLDPSPPQDIPLTIYQVQEDKVAVYPLQVQTQEGNGSILIQKTYEVAPDFNPEMLVEKPFEQDGYHFEKQEILKQPLPDSTETKLAYQTLSFECEEQDERKVLKALAPVMDFEENGFSGQLRLDAATLVVEADGYEYYQYTVTKTQEYNALDRNDPVYMEKNTDQNGVSMKLMDVEWAAQSEIQVADSLVPSLYRGDAVYKGIATGKKATGYTATVSYVGELTKTTPGNVQVTVIYRGEEIPVEKPINPVPIAAAATTTTGGIFYAVFFFFLKKNTKIYNMQDGQYILVDKQRVKTQNPVIDLGILQHKAVTNNYLIVLDKLVADKLFGKSINIVGSDTKLQHRVNSNGGTYQFEIYM